MTDQKTKSAGGHRGLRRVLIAQAIVGGAVLFVLGTGYWLRAHGLTPGEFANELRRDESTPPRYDWHSIDKKHWQAASPTPGEKSEITDAREGTSAGCAIPGMVRIKGAFKNEFNGQSTGQVERLQDTACTDWISRDFPARCRTFDPVKMASALEKIPTQAMDFCIDRFEYPNVLGENPMIVSTFHEAEAVCKASSKRLCNENEWTFACEGEEARPYPYGFTRDPQACVIDRSWRPFTEGALQPRDGNKAREELDRLWQGEPSGSRSACRSPFGVYDLTGNVDEWTHTVNTTGFASILKGGYWGPVRARCRPSTRAHNEDFVAYQESFRCCAASNASTPAPKPVPPVAVLADAGAAPTTANGDGGLPSTDVADLEPEWRSPDDDDEVKAIGKARVALCSSSSSSASASCPTNNAFTGGLVAIALAMTLRRRRHHQM